MKEYIVIVIAILFTFVILGFVIDIHASQCSMPDLDFQDNLTHCPTICECARDLPKCQIPACNHLDCINWYWMCIYKWR